MPIHDIVGLAERTQAEGVRPTSDLLVRFPRSVSSAPQCRERGRRLRLLYPRRPPTMPVPFLVRRACSFGPVVRLGWGAFSAHSFGDDRRLARFQAAVDPVGTAVPAPTPLADALAPGPILQTAMAARKGKPRGARTLQQPLQPTPTPPLSQPMQRRARELGFEVKKIEPAAVAEE